MAQERLVLDDSTLLAVLNQTVLDETRFEFGAAMTSRQVLLVRRNSYFLH